MGLYDGLGGTSTQASAYHLARTTHTPVILIADGRGTSLTLASVIKGMQEHGKSNLIVAGHMASDSLGFNQILDAWEAKGIEVVRISGIV